MEKKLLNKIEKQIKLFLENIKEHGENTQEAGEVIQKYVSRKKLSD